MIKPLNSKIVVRNGLSSYQYMGYLREAIKEKTKFKYTRINQLGARLSGKTTSDNIEMIRAMIQARETKQRLGIYIFRMRHKDINDA